MKTQIYKDNYPQESGIFVLAGDIGGTNTNLALMALIDGDLVKLLETVTPTHEITDFIDPLSATLREIKKQFTLDPTPIQCCCISAAGPIRNNYCKLTNASWFVDGNLIQNTIGIKTYVINDFIALSYGIPLLDINDPLSIAQFPNPQGIFPKQTGKTKAVIGAGTGLGVGYIPWIGDRYRACPSEGGHFDFPAFDDETTALMLYLRNQLGFHPGTERLVSGQGLSFIFQWLADTEGLDPADEILQTVLHAKVTDRPYLISKNADTHPFCARVHKIFRKIYGKMAGNYASVFIPDGGLYIAGGVISKDERLFLSDNTFMSYFSQNHKPNISELLASVPVYIVKDYSTSLLGAAAAGIALYFRE